MRHKSYSWMAQEADRLEGLYAQRTRQVARSTSLRDVLRLAQVPSRPDLRAFHLRGPAVLEKAVLHRLVTLAALELQALDKISDPTAREAACLLFIKQATLLEKRYAWLFRQLRAEALLRLENLNSSSKSA